MHRIDHDTRQRDKHGAGKDGFSEGDPEAQVPATVVTARFLDALQEELARAVEGGGAQLDPNNHGQLAQRLAGFGQAPIYTPGGWGVGEEVNYVDGNGNPVPRQLYMLASPFTAVPGPTFNGSWSMKNSAWVYTPTAPGALWSFLNYPLLLPRDATLTGVTVFCDRYNIGPPYELSEAGTGLELRVHTMHGNPDTTVTEQTVHDTGGGNGCLVELDGSYNLTFFGFPVLFGPPLASPPVQGNNAIWASVAVRKQSGTAQSPRILLVQASYLQPGPR